MNVLKPCVCAVGLLSVLGVWSDARAGEVLTGTAVVDQLGFVGNSFSGNSFRVTPYVQHPTTNAMSLLWLTTTNTEATVRWWPKGKSSEAQSASVTPRQATELDYFGYSHTKQYLPAMIPWQYRYRIENLEPDSEYEYEVTLTGGETYAKSFRTAPAEFRPIRFIAYSDSETQPSSSGDCVVWEDVRVDGDTNAVAAAACSRKYYVDQTTGYASNVVLVASRKPDFIVAAGDLAEKGSDQTHWDEYWRHNAGKLNDPAGSIPILAAPGNHEYHAYAEDAGERGMRKFLSYFEFEPNGTSLDADRQERFHRVDYGPVAMIFIDPNNGPDNEVMKDTNIYLSEKTCRAPDFNEGSVQYQWLEEQLKDAQKNKLFTFLVCHQCPFSVGYHGRVMNEKGTELYGEELSGAATRCLTNLVFKYGVDGWICGHDEIYEHSQISGVEVLPDGTTVPHTVNVYDVGIAGDGLRGCRRTTVPNPYEVFRAHVDAPEVYDTDGTLVSGGKHYGHLEVNVTTNETGRWTATLTPVYNFVSKNVKTGAIFMERRTYPDEIVLTNTVYAPPQPESIGVARIGDTTYESLDAAFMAAVSGDKVEMMTDVALAETLTIDASKAATFDLGGCTLSLADGFSADQMIDIAGTTMTITNGTVNTGAKQVNLRDNSVITVAANTLFQMTGTYSFRVNVATLNVYGEFINTTSDLPAIQLYKPGAVANVYEGAHVCAKGDAIRVNFNDGAAYLNIYGGLVESNGGYPVIYAYKSGNTSVITITGGTFKTTGGDNPEIQGMIEILKHHETTSYNCDVTVTPLTDACKAKFSTNYCGWKGKDGTVDQMLVDFCAAGYEPVKGEDGFYTIQAKQSKPEPYTPIQADDPEAKAQEINNGGTAAKKQVMAPPEGATVTDDYYGYFSAVPGVASVTMALNVDGTNAVDFAVQTADEAVLDAVLDSSGTSAEMTVANPLAGFYYSLRQNAKLTLLDYTDKNKLGGRDEIKFSLEKPASSGFYQVIVTPKAVE